MEHDTVRCVPPPGSEYLRWTSRQFQVLGSPATSDDAVGMTLDGDTSFRHVVKVKPDYLGGLGPINTPEVVLQRAFNWNGRTPASGSSR
jgi:hypothetical protein